MTYTERATRVFDYTTTNAQAGDYFKLPYQPTFRVVACIDLGDYISYLVQSGSNTPEQWDVMKPAAELFEQERNRLEIEQAEIEMSAIIHDASQEEIEEALGLLQNPKYDWLTEPIGTNADAIFGAENLVACHKCGGHGCAYCGYGGLKPEPLPIPYSFMPKKDKSTFRFQVESNGYRVLLNNKLLGHIQRIRNEAAVFLNTPESYYWMTTSSDKQFSSPVEAAQSIG